MRRISAAVLVAGALLAGAGPAPAYYELSGVFIPDDACQAFDSIRRETNPGDVLVVPGQSYNARGLNREEGDYVHVDVPEAVPRTRWVSLACGDLFRQAEPIDPNDPLEPIGDFRPFFDQVDGDGDPSPKAPALSALDRAMLKVCGGWGSRPLQADFRAALDDAAAAAEVDQIFQALDGSVLGERREARQFKDELATVWFGEEGFRHIFCGEPSGSTVGGLHFAARYLQMQEQGWGGLAERCNRTEIAPPVYTLGVAYRTPRGRVRTACPKGYGLNLDAREILIEATKALKFMRPRTSGKEMCLHKVEEANERSYLAVFVIKSGAVRTFFPDASPACDRNRPAEACLCAP